MDWTVPGFYARGVVPKFLALFDIDGTLLIGVSVHKKGFYAALKEVYGIDVAVPWRSYSGLTDPLIMRDLATKAGLAPDLIEAKLPRALEVIGDHHEQHYLEDDSKVLPGVLGLLKALQGRCILTGLATGNVVKCAYYKLKRLGLEDKFALGGFGSDDSDRARLILLAIERARRGFQFEYNGKNVVYLADTPMDVAAAKKAGVPVIIARNERTLDEPFDDPRPDLLVDSMEAGEEILDFIDRLEQGGPGSIK